MTAAAKRAEDRRVASFRQLRAVDNDLFTSLPLLANAQARRLITQYRWRYVDEDTLRKYRNQTLVFIKSYNVGSSRKIENLSRAELVSYVRRFVQFKSSVDPRIRGRIEPVPRALTPPEARRLAADIVTVADFFSLPLEFFLGIGAMENNYMNIKGDLEHTVWKKRAEPGDVVLKRRRGRVLVLNPASGVWQITRETLRYVHRLYLADARDYCKLPEHLHPSKDLKIDEVPPAILTTYAGLLFRQLLDRFNGDVATAVGAYNGGPGNPNTQYEERVRIIAEYARQIMQQAAALQGRPVATTRLLRARK